MTAITTVAEEFLKSKRVAVTGVSRHPSTHGANVVYKRFRDRGYEVFAVNPNAATVEGDKSYPNLTAIPGGVDLVVIGTRPEIAEQTMHEAAELGIERVWMHGGPGKASCSPAAESFGRQHGITVINGGCPLMFGPTADTGHKLMRWIFGLTGAVPREIPA